MIDTVVTKDQQLRNGYFQTGTGPKEILILGSCRTVPYVTYLSQWNKGAGNNALTIRRIDPCDWAFSNIDLTTLETDGRILAVLNSCDIFIHEYLVNYGMFNTSEDTDKNIYHFGMQSDLRILIPNFNDHLILENDWVDYGAVTPPDYQERGEAEIEKFCSHCDHSSFPEFAQAFRDTWRVIRYFWRPNHVSAMFTKAIFKLIDDNFLHLGIGEVTNDDLFKDPHTLVTQRDRDGYQLKW